MKPPQTVADWAKWVAVVVGAITAVYGLWRLAADRHNHSRQQAIEMHDAGIEASLESIDYQLRLQTCQRAKRARGETFEVSQLECAQEVER